ncbi:MAG: ABC transporter permease [Pseudonocardia sp.]
MARQALGRESATTGGGAVAVADGERLDDPGPARRVVPRRSARQRRARHRVAVWAGRIGLAVFLLALWELGSGHLFDSLIMSRPSAIAEVFGRWLADGTIVRHGLVTLQVAVIGFVIASAMALVLGLVLGRSKLFGAILDPYISTLYSLPRLALVPLLIMWFGIGLQFKVVLVVILVFFLMFSSVYAGVRDVDQNLINAARVMGAGRLGVYRHVILPSTLVWIAAGLKVSIPYALAGAVVSEILAANQGLGYLVSQQAAQFRAAGMFAALITILVVSYVANLASESITRRALRWQGDGQR